MNTKQQEDLRFGAYHENRTLNVLQKYFNMKLNKTSEFHAMDFESETAFFEVKSRRVRHNAYPTTMVGQNKVEYAQRCGKVVYFVFAFTDGIYFYKFNPEDPLTISTGGRCDRGRYEYKDYCYIPVGFLKKMGE